MTFIWPLMLVSLVLLLPLVLIYTELQQRRRRLAAQYGSLTLLQEGTRRLTGIRRHIPAALFLVALAILLVALARPQAQVTLPRIEGTVILAFDVSGSMSGDDMKPTRLEAAKAAARDFVQRQPPGVAIGVVTFSDGGFSIQAPSTDQGTVLTAISRLKVQTATSLSSGIESALKAIQVASTQTGEPGDGEPPSLSLSPTPTPPPVPKGTYTSAAIVLLTDGENTAGADPMTAAKDAADRGVRVYTVGIGSPSGAILHINGVTVRSRLDEATLKQIADMTGGTYYNAQTEEDLHAIYDNLSPQLIMKPQTTEVTAIFAGAGILVLMAGGALSLLWFGRVP